MAFPSVAARLTQSFLSASSYSINMPATVNAGDLLLLVWDNNDSGATTHPSTPAGWTLQAQTDNASIVAFSLWAKIANGTEGGTSLTLSSTGARAGCAHVFRITGWHGDLTGLEISGPSVPSNGTSNAPPSLTASWGAEDNLWIAVAAVGDDDATFVSYPTDFTNGAYVVSGGGTNAGSSLGTAWRLLNAASVTPGSFTLSELEGWILTTIVVRPAAGGAATVIPHEVQQAQSLDAVSLTVTGGVLQIDSLLQAQSVDSVSVGSELGFDADFERSNLDVSLSSIVDPATSTPAVTIVPRVQTTESATKYWYWFFKLTDANGKTPTFSIASDDHYLGNFNFPRPVFSYDRVNWTEFDNFTNTNPATFSHNTAFTQNTVYVSYHYPYGMTELANYISSTLDGNPYVSEPASSSGNGYVFAQTIVQTADDGRVIQPQPLYSFMITDAAQQPDDGTRKRVCVLFAGTHAGEDIGNFQLQGAIDFLLGGSAKAAELRKNWIFLIYPMVNPAGRYGGHFRGSWEPGALTANPNREINTGVLDHMTKVRDAVLLDTGGACDAFADFHGWHGTGNYGYYGADIAQVDNWVAAIEVYVGTLQDHGPDQISWNTGFHRTQLGAEHSFTPETHHDNMDNVAEMYAYGQGTMEALDDLFQAGDFFILPIDDLVQAQSVQSAAATPNVPTITPADSQQAQTVEAVPLTEHAAIAPADSQQSQTVGQSGLTEHASLPVDPLDQVQTVDGVILTATGTLAPDQLMQLQALGGVVLTEHNTLSVDPLDQVQSVDTVTLTVAGTIAIDPLEQGQSLEVVALTEHAALAVAGIDQAQALDPVTLTAADGPTLVVASLSQAQQLGAAGLTQHGMLVVDDTVQQQILDGVTFSGAVGWLRGRIVIVSAMSGEVRINKP